MVIIIRELIILYEKLKVNEKRALRKKKIFLLFLYFCFITLDFNSIIVYNIYIKVYFFSEIRNVSAKNAGVLRYFNRREVRL